MRIALHATGEAGNRAGRILLAERSLTALGLYGQESGRVAGPKVMAIREPTGYDVLASDDDALASGLAGIAVDDGLGCVVAAEQVDEDLHQRFVGAGRTLLVGANLVSGLAASLAAHEMMARPDHVGQVTLAWTVPGKPRRRGVAIPFPDPVGPRWGKQRRTGSSSTRRVVEVPLPGPWAAATVAAGGSDDGEEARRVVGIADHADHLAGIALAAGIIAVAEGGYPPGRVRPDRASEEYLAAALRIGLGVATYTQ